ncbi:MAG TPA: pyrroline-5-carboxylate reductase [Abditibacteriaceae bacterium]|nr:pyrroline-5-carboxylate reductase [Abditibacteriaceae bacterium]
MSRIAILGAGAMGEALMRGLISAAVYAPTDIAVFDVDTARLSVIASELGVVATSDASAAAREAEVILVAIKPQVMTPALQPLREVLTPEQTLVSIAAGVTTVQLESHFTQPVPCVRVMPNTPCLVGQAASAICLGKHADARHRVVAHRIFDAVGLAVDVEEKLIDAVTGLSGSGPAYVYVFIEALSDGGVKMGLPRDVATRLAAQTVLGAAQMVLQTEKHPGALKDQVTSPGGTTIAGLHALESNGFRGTVMDAVEASARRAREMSGG